MTPRNPPNKPYTTLLAQNGNFGDMFWSKATNNRQTATKKQDRASSLIPANGSVDGDKIKRDGVKNESDQRLDQSQESVLLGLLSDVPATSKSSL